MLYDLIQGKTEKQIIEQARRNRQPIPKAIREKPTLLPGLGYIYDAFIELSTCRSVGFGEGAIPWTAIIEFARHEGLDDPDDFDYFHGLIRALDETYLEHQSKQAGRKNKSSSGSAKNK